MSEEYQETIKKMVTDEEYRIICFHKSCCGSCQEEYLGNMVAMLTTYKRIFDIYRTDLHFLCIFADSWFDEIESIRDDINLGFDPDDYYDKNYDPWVAFNNYLVELRKGEQIMKDVNNAIRCYELRNLRV